MLPWPGASWTRGTCPRTSWRDLLGCSPSHLSRVFNGTRCLSPALRQRMQEELGVGFDELFIVEESND